MRFVTRLPSGHMVLAIRDCVVVAVDVFNTRIVSLEIQEYVMFAGRRLVRVSAGSA